MSMWRTSLTFTPARLSEIDREKNAIPNDMAKRGCRPTERTGANTGRSHPVNASVHEALPLGRTKTRSLSYPVVASRMLCTRLAGGSNSASDFSQRRPPSASANNGPHTAQTRAWARKLSSLGPVSVPSSSSISSASKSAHCMPFLVSPDITSPAYMYVVAAVQVPHVHDLSWISPYPPEP